MDAPTVRLQLVVQHEGKELYTSFTSDPADTLASVLQTALSRLSLRTGLTWEFRWQGRPLSLQQTLAEAVPDAATRAIVFLELVCLSLPDDERVSSESAPSVDLEMTRTDVPAPAQGASRPRKAAAPAAPRAAPPPLMAPIVRAGRRPLAALMPAAAAPAPGRDRAPAAAPEQVKRHASVRYYSRMNPQGTYPLLVVLSQKEIRKIQQESVDQRSTTVEVARGATVEIEPILPGCHCHPARRAVSIQDADIKAHFWVVPLVLGAVKGAAIELRVPGEDKPLAEIPLDIQVVKTTWVAIMGMATFVYPFITAALRHYEVDVGSELQAGLPSYLTFLREFLNSAWLVPVVTVLLLSVTALAWWWTRPRPRDLFWDIDPVGSGAGARLARSPSRLGIMILFAFQGAMGLGVLGLVLLGIIAATSSVAQALSLASLVLSVSLLAGALFGAILGTVEEVDHEEEE